MAIQCLPWYSNGDNPEHSLTQKIKGVQGSR